MAGCIQVIIGGLLALAGAILGAWLAHRARSGEPPLPRRVRRHRAFGHTEAELADIAGTREDHEETGSTRVDSP